MACAKYQCGLMNSMTVKSNLMFGNQEFFISNLQWNQLLHWMGLRRCGVAFVLCVGGKMPLQELSNSWIISHSHVTGCLAPLGGRTCSYIHNTICADFPMKGDFPHKLFGNKMSLGLFTMVLRSIVLCVGEHDAQTSHTISDGRVRTGP